MSNYYVNPGEFWDEMKQSTIDQQLTRRAIEIIQLLAKRITDSNHYKYEEDKEDCMAGGITDCIKYWKNYYPYNKRMIIDLLKLELIHLSEAEFKYKEFEPQKSIAPDYITTKDGVRMARFSAPVTEDYIYLDHDDEDISNRKKKERVAYKGVIGWEPELIKLMDEKVVEDDVVNVMNIKGIDDYTILDIMKGCESVDDFIALKTVRYEEMNTIKNLLNDGYELDLTTGNFIKENENKTYIREEYILFRKDGEVKTEDDMYDVEGYIEYNLDDAYDNLVWTDTQIKVRKQLYEEDSIKNIKEIPQHIKELYNRKVKSNTFSYFTSLVKNGLAKQWKEIHKAKENQIINLGHSNGTGTFHKL